METLLLGIKGVLVCIDDILITGPTTEEHLSTLDKVLEKLSVAGLRLKKSKCFFLQPSIEPLPTASKGYKVGEEAERSFHNFLFADFGRHFSIKSDHQPLSYLFNETKGVSQTASSRIQRWALTLGAYHYPAQTRGYTEHADALSRLPRPTTTSADCLPGDFVHLIDTCQLTL